MRFTTPLTPNRDQLDHSTTNTGTPFRGGVSAVVIANFGNSVQWAASQKVDATGTHVVYIYDDAPS